MNKAKSKIGVLTFYSAHNYGAVLQAFSLQQTIKELGYNPEFIRWKDHFASGGKPTSLLKVAKRIISLFGLNARLYLKSKQAFNKTSLLFDSFRREKLILRKSPTYDHEDLANMACEYNGFITGSDMVWTDIGQDLYTYFLQFAPFEKRGSYAPSLTGTIQLSSQKKRLVKQYIEGIKYLSFREKEGVDFAKEECDLSSTLVVDPTMLHDITAWKKMLDLNDCKSTDKYVLCYMLGGVPAKIRKKIKIFASRNGLKIRYIPISFYEAKQEIKNGYAGFCGPKDFVELFSNASFVITNSYHGFLFSLISNVPFIVLEREKTNQWKLNEERITSLLDDIHEKKRLIGLDDDFKDDFFSINYEDINSLLTLKREQSINYLNNVLSQLANIEIEYMTVDRKDISELSPKQCTGCGVCAKICPKDAIVMKEDFEGFSYPEIDLSKCAHCQKCVHYCHAANHNTKSLPLNTLMAYSNANGVNKSASGGIFYSVAKSFIEKVNGFVVGAAMEEDKKVKHIIVDNIQELKKLQGSKYVQSDSGCVFENIKLLLDNEKYVLFSGCPCQVASLKRYLNKDYEKLFTIDLICHGVPSQKLWLSAVDDLERKGRISNFVFRNKENEKEHHSSFQAQYYVNGKKVSRSYSEIPYYRFFIENASFMKSCYYCEYAGEKRVGDMTLGDCDSWREQIDFNKEKAISSVLLNSNKGNWMWELINEDCASQRLDYAIECKTNTTLFHPTPKPYVRDTIYDSILKNGWKQYEERKGALHILKRILLSLRSK